MSIILKRGFIRRHRIELNMQKVESVGIDQTLIGRLFNFGDGTIRGVVGSYEIYLMIHAPLKLRTNVNVG